MDKFVQLLAKKVNQYKIFTKEADNRNHKNAVHFQFE